MQFTTYDDTAAYTAAAALDDRPVPDQLFVRYPDVRPTGVREYVARLATERASGGAQELTVRATLTGAL